MTIVVDTSVALNWTIREEGSEQALKLLSERLIAPDLIQAELGCALTRKVRRGEILPEQARLAFGETVALLVMLPSPIFAAAALELALQLEHSIYDCYFLAAAELLGGFLITADRPFAAEVRRTSLAPLILLLGEEVPNV